MILSQAVSLWRRLKSLKKNPLNYFEKDFEFNLRKWHSDIPSLQSSNTQSALKNQNVRSVAGWTDRTVVLYWLNGQGSHNQFVRNRVNKILEKDDINWQYVPTRDNPADLGSRGSVLTKIPEIWWKGPSWLQVKEN